MSHLQYSSKEIQERLDSVWTQCGWIVYGRLEILTRSAAAMERGKFNAEIERQCAEETHALLGELGIFGFTRASEFALAIDLLLKKSECRTSSDAAAISALIILLRKELDGVRPSLPEVSSVH